MRICHLSKFYPPAIGGVETYVQTIATAQAESGMSVTVFCLHHLNSPTESEATGLVKLIRFRRRISFAKLDFCPGLIRAIKALNVDIIHLHSPNPTMILAVLLSKTKIPIVVTYQSDHVAQKIRAFLFRPLEKLFANRVKANIATSPTYAEGSLYFKPYKEKTVVVPMGLDLEPFTSPSTQARILANSLLKQYKDPIWLCCGRLVPYKGIRYSIEALKTTPGTLFIVGDGPERNALVEQAKLLNLSNRVVFLGSLSREKIVPYYLAAKALWFSSCTRAEAFGLVQVEAMAAGCPVINTAIPISGVSWVSPHEQTGLTVPQRNPNAISRAALRLLNEEGLRDRLSQNARKRAVDEFSLTEMIKKTNAIYKLALKKYSAVSATNTLPTHPMKTLYINPTGALGGAEHCLIDLLKSLKTQPINIEAHFLEIVTGPLTEKIRELGIQVTSLLLPEKLTVLGDSYLKNVRYNPSSLGKFLLNGFCGIPSGIAYVIRLRRVISKLAPDTIHLNGLKAGFLFALTGYSKASVLWHMHDFVGSRVLVSRLISMAVKNISVIVTNSDAVAKDVSRFVSKVPVKRVYNGIDTDCFSPAVKERAYLDKLSKLHLSEPGTLRIGLVATYGHWKGHLVFLKAASILCANPLTRKIRFYIVGSPIYQTEGSQFSVKELRDYATSVGLSDIGFIPHQENIVPIYRALDIVVHASTEPEPFGRVIIEAMACEKPVIVSAAGGAKELFTEGKDAVSFKPGDSENLVQQMRTLIEQPGIRKALGVNARRTVLSKFSIDDYTLGIINCYQSFRQIGSTAPDLSKRFIVAMGYLEDSWLSSRHITQGLFQAVSKRAADVPLLKDIHLHAPNCFKTQPGWIHRRIRFGRQLSSGNILQLMDHSYGDSLLKARHNFNYLSVLIHDVAFWRYRNPFNQHFRKRIVEGLSVADCRIAVSQSTAKDIENELGLTVQAVIPSGLPLELFPHSGQERDPNLLLHVGGIDERKGIDRLFRFIAILPKSFRLVHVGKRFTQSQKKMLSFLGIAERVEERGYLDPVSLKEIYHRASALICPSRYEGFGLPIIEARLCGTPVIVNHTVPALEHLQNDPATLRLDFGVFDSDKTRSQQEKLRLSFLNFNRAPVRFENREYFSWERAAMDYINLFERHMDTQKKADWI